MSQLQLKFDVWPPEHWRLPNLDRLEEISRGTLLPESPAKPRDQSKEARIARLTDLPGVTMADKIPAPPSKVL